MGGWWWWCGGGGGAGAGEGVREQGGGGRSISIFPIARLCVCYWVRLQNGNNSNNNIITDNSDKEPFCYPS